MEREAAGGVADEIGGGAIEWDVSRDDSAEAASAASRDAVGGARICVNCAGIGPAARIVGRSRYAPESYAVIYLAMSHDCKYRHAQIQHGWCDRGGDCK